MPRPAPAASTNLRYRRAWCTLQGPQTAWVTASSRWGGGGSGWCRMPGGALRRPTGRQRCSGCAVHSSWRGWTHAWRGAWADNHLRDGQCFNVEACCAAHGRSVLAPHAAAAGAHMAEVASANALPLSLAACFSCCCRELLQSHSCRGGDWYRNCGCRPPRWPLLRCSCWWWCRVASLQAPPPPPPTLTLPAPPPPPPQEAAAGSSSSHAFLRASRGRAASTGPACHTHPRHLRHQKVTAIATSLLTLSAPLSPPAHNNHTTPSSHNCLPLPLRALQQCMSASSFASRGRAASTESACPTRARHRRRRRRRVGQSSVCPQPRPLPWCPTHCPRRPTSPNLSAAAHRTSALVHLRCTAAHVCRYMCVIGKHCGPDGTCVPGAHCRMTGHTCPPPRALASHRLVLFSCRDRHQR